MTGTSCPTRLHHRIITDRDTPEENKLQGSCETRICLPYKFFSPVRLEN